MSSWHSTHLFQWVFHWSKHLWTSSFDIKLHRYISFHHYQGVLTAYIPLVLSHYPSLLSIVLGGSRRRHPGFTRSWWVEVIAGQSTLLCVGIHARASLVSSMSLSCLARLTWIVREMGSKWLYSCCFVVHRFQDLFITAWILM